MRKRILSLFLAVCTVLLSIPMAVFPIFAVSVPQTEAGEGYSSRFAPDEASTWPIVEDYTISALKTGDALPVTYQGNWEIGYKDPTGNASNFTPYASLIKADSSSMILSNTGDYWNNWGGMYMNAGASTNLMFSGMAYDKSNYSLTAHNADATIRYTAEYTGTAIIRLNTLIFYADNTSALEILHNSASGTTSLTGKYAANTSQFRVGSSGAWESVGGKNVGDDLGVLMVELTAGDTIDFVSCGNDDYVAANMKDFGLAQYTGTEYNYSKRGIYKFDFEIQYVEKEETGITESWNGQNATLNTATPLPLFTWMDGNGNPLNHNDPLTNSCYAIINRTLIKDGHISASSDFATVLTEYKAYLQKATAITYAGNWTQGAIVNGKYAEINRLAFLSERTIYALKLSGSNGTTAKTTAQVNYGWDTQYWTYQAYTETAIDHFVSHATIIPANGTTAENMQLSYSQIPAGTTVSIQGLAPFGDAEAGVRYSNNHLYLRPNSNGRIGAIAYTVPTGVDLGILTWDVEAVTFNEGASFRYAIAINEKVIYPAGASLTTTSVQDGEWATYTTKEALQAVIDDLMLEVNSGDRIEFCIARPADGTKPIVDLSFTTNIDTYAPVCELDFIGSGERVYSTLVPLGETVDISALDLPANFGATGVYINNSTTLQKLPDMLTVNGNTKITDYVLESSVSFSIDSAFAFNIYVKAHGTASEAGVVIDGVKRPGNSLGNGMYKYTVSGIAPSEIPVKSISYQPYETVDGRDVISPNALTVSAKTLLDAYMQSTDPSLSMLATSIWHYSLAARDYFVNHSVTLSEDVKNALRGRTSSSETGTVDAALLSMVAAYRAGTAYQPYASGINVNSYTYKFNGASLMLQDRLSFVFRIMRTDGSCPGDGETDFRIRVQDENGETLRYATAYGFFDSSKAEMLYLVDNIPAAEYGRELYFTLVDANDQALSATLTYSVHAYLARTHNTENGDADTIHYLFRGIYQFGEATQVYVNEHSLNYDTDIVFPVGDAGDTLDGSAVLTERTYDATNATTVTADSFLSAATAMQGVYTAGGNAMTLSGLAGAYDCQGSVLVVSGGLVIENCHDLTLSHLVVDGPISIIRSANITLDGVQITHNGVALTVDANSTGVLANACRIVGSTAVANAGEDTTLYASYLGFTDYGVQDAATTGTTVQNCRLVGAGTAIHSAASESAFRFLTIEMSSTADRGIVLAGSGASQNLLVAQNVITGTRDSISISGVYNASIVLNSAVSITADGNTHLYICDNALAGRLTVENNNYLLADGNTYAHDQRDHTSQQSNNSNTNGDSLMDVDARLTTGADEALLPHVDKDQFVDMPLKQTVKDVSGTTRTTIYNYIEEQAKSSAYVVVAPGAYVTTGTTENERMLIFDSNRSNTTVYAYGVYVEMPKADTAKTSLSAHVATVGSENVTLKGFTMGYELQSSGQVHVLEKRIKNGGVYQLRVIGSAGMLNEFGDSDPNFYNTTSFQLHRVSKGEFSVYCDLKCQKVIPETSEYFDENSLVNWLTDAHTMLITVDPDIYEIINKGDVLTCRVSGGSHTVTTNGSSNTVFKDMVIYGATGGFCFYENKNTTGTTYYRVANTNRSGAVITQSEYETYNSLESIFEIDLVSQDEAGRYRGAAAHISSNDATNASNSREGAQIISCLFENLSDDGTNQHSTHARLAGAVDNGDGTTTIIYKGNFSPDNYHKYAYNSLLSCVDFLKGDRVLIYTADGQRVCDTEALSATVTLESKPSTFIPANLAGAGIKPEDFVPPQVSYKQITVATADVNFGALQGYDLTDDSYDETKKVIVDNRSHASDGFLIDNTVIDGTRSRGLLIKSSNGVVRNCTIRNTAKVAIAVIYEIYWGESSISEGLVIENNLIENTAYSTSENDQYGHYPIYIAGLGNGTLDEDHLLYNDITISGNKIVNNHAENALYIRSARDLYIYNNDFGASLQESATDPKASIYLDGVLSVELSGNIYSPYITDISQAIAGTVYDNLFGPDLA